MSERLGLAKNSLINLGRGASAALLVLVLPPILVRTLTPAEYSAWALVLQTATYIALLDLGLQVGIGRFVAREHARQNNAGREQFFMGGLTLLTLAGIAGVVVSLILSANLQFLFPKIGPALLPGSKLAVLLIGVSTAISLPGSAIVALFVGLERFSIPAIVLGIGRLIQCASVAGAAVSTHSLVDISAAYAACSLLIQAAYAFCLFRFGPKMTFRRSSVLRPVLSEIAKYCASLSVWMVGMLLVSGLDVAIVANVDFKSVGGYSICANLIAVFCGFIGAGLNVLIPRASSLDAKEDRDGLGRLLVDATQLSTFGLIGLALVAILMSRIIMGLWVGPAVTESTLSVLIVLIAANTARLVMTPYATILLGTGEQKWAAWTAMTEGCVNLFASIVLGRLLGAIGVAFGTMIGALVGTWLAIQFTLPRAQRISCSASKLFLSGLLRPAACYTPLVASVSLYMTEQTAWSGLAVLGGTVLTGWWTVRAGPAIINESARKLVAKLVPKTSEPRMV